MPAVWVKGNAVSEVPLLPLFERRYLRSLMDACQGNLSAASRQSGVDRKHLRALLRRHGLAAAE